MCSIACALASTRCTSSAPRLAASSPSAPEPAKRSSTRLPSKPQRTASEENSPSRALSEVGRVPSSGTVMVRPRAWPAMILVMTYTLTHRVLWCVSVLLLFLPDLYCQRNGQLRVVLDDVDGVCIDARDTQQ